jgi:putative DNA primase/helicase
MSKKKSAKSVSEISNSHVPAINDAEKLSADLVPVTMDEIVHAHTDHHETVPAIQEESEVFESGETGAEDPADMENDDQGEKAVGKSEPIVIHSRLSRCTYHIDNGILFFVSTNQEGKVVRLPLCSEIRVVSDARDTDNKTWCRLLEFEDGDGVTHQYLAKTEDLDSETIFSTLMSMGLIIYPGRGRKERLTIYLLDTDPLSPVRLRCVSKTGWHGKTFVLPDGESIGNNDDHYIYLGSKHHTRSCRESGTLEEWRNNIARYCEGSSRLTLAVCAAFAAPLLKLAGEESGGINLFGSSSIGKTTALYAAASVFGDPSSPEIIKSWRATSNGLEGAALRANDSLLILDEIGQVDPKEAGDTAYMLANGSGKTRANRSGDSRLPATWTLGFISTGETTLAGQMNEGGKKVKAGQEIRMLDIPADVGRGLGIFGALHGFASGAVLSEAIKRNSRAFHGTPIRPFIEHVIRHYDDMPQYIQRTRERFLAKVLSEGETNGQIRRAANRFALYSVAGEYASEIGITGWEPSTSEKDGVAFDAIRICFQAWLDARGGSEVQEVTTLLAQIRLFLENHGDSRFTLLNANREAPELANDRTITNRAGFRRRTTAGYEYLVFPETFKTEVCRGVSLAFAIKILRECQPPGLFSSAAAKVIFHFSNQRAFN